MEPDSPPSAGFYNFLGWLDVNKKRVALGAAGLALLGAIIGVVVWRSGEREVEAAQALSAVRIPFSPAEPLPPGTAEAFLKVNQDYPKTKAGGDALLRAAAVFFDQENYPKALETFERFLRNYTETPYSAQAVFGIASCLDAQNKTAEAIAKYNEFLKSYPAEPAAEQARLNLARLYENSNQPAQAAEALNKILSGGQTGPTAAEAQERLKGLYAKHPNLAPPPPPSATPTLNPLIRTNVFTSTNPVRSTNFRLPTTNTSSNGQPAQPRLILPTAGQTNAK